MFLFRLQDIPQSSKDFLSMDFFTVNKDGETQKFTGLAKPISLDSKTARYLASILIGLNQLPDCCWAKIETSQSDLEKQDRLQPKVKGKLESNKNTHTIMMTRNDYEESKPYSSNFHVTSLQ